MKDFSRLLRYAKPYWPALAASVLFMAVVGLSQGLLVKLIPLVFERVLDPKTPDKPALLFAVPFSHFKIYLNQLVPSFITNIWTMVAFGIVALLLRQGHMRLPGQLSGELGWHQRRDGPAARGLRAGFAAGCQFLRAARHGSDDVAHHGRYSR